MPMNTPLGSFFDVEGAFNYTFTSAVSEALASWKVQKFLRTWITANLTHRTVEVVAGTAKITIITLCDFPQGRALSPLLWSLVADRGKSTLTITVVVGC